MSSSRWAMALSMTIVVSPEVQVVLGNGMGMVGWLFPLSLALVAILHLFTLQVYGDIYGGRYRQDNEYAFLSAAFGPWLPLFTSLASRLVFMVCVATISLVTAGYVFNEVFVYWFANFAFAFLLLALVLVLHLVGRSWALKVQNILVIVVLAMVAVLVASALPTATSLPAAGEIDFQVRGLLLPFFLVVGFECAFLTQNGQPRVGQLAKVFGGLLLLFVLWGGVMSQVVEPSRLARSFNPQMLVAHQVLGQPGRYLMGVAVIAGAAALVNGLFLVLRHQLAELVPAPWWATASGKKKKWLAVFGVLALAAAPALMMATGMAGEELIDVYGRAALVFWLFQYSLIHFALVVRRAERPWLHLSAGLMLIGAVVALGCTDPQPFVFLKSIAMMVVALGPLSLLMSRVTKSITQGG